MITRSYPVEISHHAWQRWQERAHRPPYTLDKLRRLIEVRLNQAVGAGLQVEGGMVRLDMDDIEVRIALSDKYVVKTVVMREVVG